VRLFHRTFAAASILSEGFRDGHGMYLTNQCFSGVWLSDKPLDINEGADGDVLLALDIPGQEVESYEWKEEGKGYREFLVPAEIVNQYGPPKIINSEAGLF